MANPEARPDEIIVKIRKDTTASSEQTSAKGHQLTGDVLAVGTGEVLQDGSVREPLVKPGDFVTIARDAGNEVDLQGQEYLVVREHEILSNNRPS